MRSVEALCVKGLVLCTLITAALILLTVPAAAESVNLVSLTNQQREKQGLIPLTVSEELNVSAYKKANHMINHNYWGHSAPGGTEPWVFIEESGYDFQYAGENLAKDFLTDEATIKALMESEAHRANILNERFTEIGVAKVSGELDGKPTTLVVFHYGLPETEPEEKSAPRKGLFQSTLELLKGLSRIQSLMFSGKFYGAPLDVVSK